MKELDEIEEIFSIELGVTPLTVSNRLTSMNIDTEEEESYIDDVNDKVLVWHTERLDLTYGTLYKKIGFTFINNNLTLIDEIY